MARRTTPIRKDTKDRRQWAEKNVSVFGMATDIFGVVASIPAVFTLLLFLSFYFHLGPANWNFETFSESVGIILRRVHL